MDNRLNVRVPIQLPVQLWTPDGVLLGATLDLSFEGTRVRLNVEAPRPQGTLQVCFEPDTVGVSVPAVAVRQEDGELGLMFGRYDGAADVYLTNRLSDALDRVRRNSP